MELSFFIRMLVIVTAIAAVDDENKLFGPPSHEDKRAFFKIVWPWYNYTKPTNATATAADGRGRVTELCPSGKIFDKKTSSCIPSTKGIPNKNTPSATSQNVRDGNGIKKWRHVHAARRPSLRRNRSRRPKSYRSLPKTITKIHYDINKIILLL